MKRLLAAAAMAAAVAGCSSGASQKQKDARDAQFVQMADRNYQLERELAASRAQSATLNANRGGASERPAPASARPASRTIEIPTALKSKGVKQVTREGRTALLLPGAVLFGPGSTSLSKDAKATLKQVGALLKKQAPGAHIRVEGHTDSDPVQKSRRLYKNNQELSEARAKAVRDYLQKDGGLEGGRLEVVGHGEAQPIASNKTAAGKKENRRVELVILTD